jgi:hypothetical protein
MSAVAYLPVPKKSSNRPRPRGRAIISCSQAARIVHELKNCMSVLVLLCACDEGNAGQSTNSRLDRQTLAEVIAEMDRLVSEFVRLVEKGSHPYGRSAKDA